MIFALRLQYSYVPARSSTIITLQCKMCTNIMPMFFCCFVSNVTFPPLCILLQVNSLLAISNFPARRQRVVDKVKRTADALACKLEDAMQKDLLETTESLEKYVKLIGKPYQDLAQEKVDKLLATQEELTNVEHKLSALQIQIQNLHIS